MSLIISPHFFKNQRPRKTGQATQGEVPHQTTKNPLRASKAHRGKSIIKIMKQPDGLHHAAHAATHAGSASGHSGLGLLLLGDDTLGRQEHAGDAGSVLQSDA